MSNNEYSRSLTTGVIAHVEGETLVFDGPALLEGGTLVIDEVNFLPQNVDYTDNDSVKMLATSAVYTADGFCDLVKQNCNTTDPDISHGAHLEMYLALAGLACEIYMKAIIYHENLHGGKQARGHKLDDLFGQLPSAMQGAISSKISNIAATLPAIKDMFTTLRYDFEQNQIKGDYLIVFELMEELKTIAYAYPQKKPGAVKYANGILAFE
jgi:hypothetical protein